MKNIFTIAFILFIFKFNSHAQLSPNGLHFDGIDDVVTVPYSPAFTLGTSNFTIEAWIRDEATAGVPSEEEILSDDPWVGGGGFRFCIVSGQLVLFIHGIGTGGGPDLRDNICHHVAVTVSGTGSVFFVDGVQVATGFGKDTITTMDPIYIGNYPSAGPGAAFKGLIKEVRLWNVARTSGQIASNMTTIVSGAGLIGYWRCSEGSGQTVGDFSGGLQGSLGYNFDPGTYPTWTTGCTCAPPNATITAGGSTSFCTGGSVTLNANTGTGLTYQWKKNNVAVNGATFSSYTTSTSGSYTVVVTNSSSCSASSNAIVVTANPIPSATITPNGNLNFCTGPGVSLQANTGAGLTYQWRKNSVNISGATTSSYLANSTGTFNVVVTNNSGCSKGATPVNVTSPPSITITPSGPTHFCTGGSVTLTVTSGQTVTYKWKKNGAYISGATNATYLATSTGSYNCVITNSFGCSKGGTPIAVSGPPSAVITANGATTFCAGSVQLSAQSGYTYQWIKNSGNINGATQQNYSATTAGNYKVKVTDPFGCSKTTPNSNQITVNVPCREGHFLNDPYDGISIYPNPSSGIVEMMVPSEPNKNIEIEIYSPDGKLIKKQIVEANNPFTIDLSQQADGVYFIHSLADGQFISRKIVKQ